MRWVKLLVAVSLVVGPVVVTAGSAKAQVFLNLYAGAVFPQLEDTEAKADMLEYTGQGLGALSSLMEAKERKMAVLGARMLEEQKKASEAAETLHLRMSGESGTLAAIVKAAGESMEQALRWVADWMRLSGDVVYKFNTDFVAAKLDPQLLIALMGARQSGEISQKTFLYNLQQGELLRPDVTIEEELDEIEIEPPGIMNEPGV